MLWGMITLGNWNALEYQCFDLNYCLLRAKPLCLTPDQHARVNCLYELSLAKTNHIIINGFNPDEITDTINVIAAD